MVAKSEVLESGLLSREKGILHKRQEWNEMTMEWKYQEGKEGIQARAGEVGGWLFGAGLFK